MKNNNGAFWHGFMRGLAAPSMLFSSYPDTEIRRHAMQQLYQPASSDRESLRNDVMRIGDDMRRAMQKYGEK